MKPHYNVVAAVVLRDGRIFCVRRGKTKYPYTSYLFEFPGGKIEPGETEEQALMREMKEELNFDIRVERKLADVSYDYPDFSVELHFFLCSSMEFSNIVLTEHIESRWVSIGEIETLEWVAADKEFVVEKLHRLLSD